MNKIKFHYKFLLLLISLLLLQSCQIYRSKSSSPMEAIEKDRRVKITFKNDKSYKFKRLQKQEDQLIGLTKSNSKSAEKFKDQIFEISNDPKYVRVKINENSIEKIQVHNKTASALVNFGVPIVIGGVILVGSVFAALAGM